MGGALRPIFMMMNSEMRMGKWSHLEAILEAPMRAWMALALPSEKRE